VDCEGAKGVDGSRRPHGRGDGIRCDGRRHCERFDYEAVVVVI
jgi:hypothetical protein